MAQEEKVKRLRFGDMNTCYHGSVSIGKADNGPPMFISNSIKSDQMCEIHRLIDDNFLVMGGVDSILFGTLVLEEKGDNDAKLHSQFVSRKGIKFIVPHPTFNLFVGANEEQFLNLMKKTELSLDSIGSFDKFDFRVPTSASYFPDGELVCSYESTVNAKEFDPRVVLFDASTRVKRVRGSGSAAFELDRFAYSPVCFAHGSGFVGIKEGMQNELKLYDSELNKLISVVELPYSQETGKFSVAPDGTIAYLLTGFNGGSTITFFDPRKIDAPYGYVNMHNLFTDNPCAHKLGLFGEENKMSRKKRIVHTAFDRANALMLLSNEADFAYIRHTTPCFWLTKR